MRLFEIRTLTLFRFNARLFLGPSHDAVAVCAKHFGQFLQRVEFADDDRSADAFIIQITFGYVKGFGIF